MLRFATFVVGILPILFVLSACSNAVSASSEPAAPWWHINGHSITLYNEAVRLDKIGDYDAAIRDFRQSAKLGNIRAMLWLGLAYADGHHVLVDRTRAKYWINMAYHKADIMHDDRNMTTAMVIWKRFRLWKY